MIRCAGGPRPVRLLTALFGAHAGEVCLVSLALTAVVAYLAPGLFAQGPGPGSPPASPTVTAVNPSEGDRGENLDVVITGTDFQEGATASFGSGTTVNSATLNSATQLTANLTIAEDAATGPRDVTVTNPGDQSGTLTDGFTVYKKAPEPPAAPGSNPPTVASVTPTSGTEDQTLSVAIAGSDFQDGATSAFGSGVTVTSTTFSSATQLTASLTVAADAVAGSREVTVTNPDGQVGTLANGFEVTEGTAPPGPGQQAHTFPAGPVAVSVPQDGFDPAGLLAGGGIIARWNPHSTNYPTFAKWEFQPAVTGAPGRFAGPLERGRGYFRGGNSAAQVSFTPGADEDFEILVTPGAGENAGWNLLGNPHWRAVDLGELRARRQGEPSTQNRSLSGAAGANIVADYAWGYPVTDQGSYTLNGYQLYSVSYPNSLTEIPAGAGLWFFVIQSAAIHWPGSTQPPSPGGPSNGDGGTPQGPGEPPANPVLGSSGSWRVKLQVRGDSCCDDYNYFGVGRANFPLLNPPRSLGGPHVDLYFVPGSRDAACHRLAASLAGTGRAGRYTWRFAVESNLTGEAIIVSWPDLSLAPSALRLVLTDLATGTPTSMRTANAYSYTNDSAIARHFVIHAEPTSSSQLRISGFAARPTRGGAFDLVYTLSEAADVSVRLVTAAGRMASPRARLYPSKAGLNRVVWRAGTESNGPTRGVYLIELVARTESGSASKALTTVRWR